MLYYFIRLSYLHGILEEFNTHQRVTIIGEVVPLLLKYVH